MHSNQNLDMAASSMCNFSEASGRPLYLTEIPVHLGILVLVLVLVLLYPSHSHVQPSARPKELKWQKQKYKK
ncbi:hypothetical protein K505DRAFT_329104 [Melanomma pulvis-pyrius CBS 109.77]|uniref:Uncharacterized protein n=1 Tax=Melanomma pulvis-pyrius CBS 109.77 TaxID=1314802 RepID=A0A6A6WW88_9PLEO|nr:hypothetical protein K505DRAFT_329104 [Melanomma pulvis-pyrius CBS 109.77]